MAKADKTYVYQGQIYLEGAEMPEDWKKPEEKGPTPGVKMHGPEGLLPQFPPNPLPPGVKKPEEADLMAGENPGAFREEQVVLKGKTDDKDTEGQGSSPAAKAAAKPKGA